MTHLPSPRFPDPSDAPALRWGVLGPGGIASTFVGALQRRSTQHVVGAASRTHARAAEFAERFGLDLAYPDYVALVSDPQIDVVYIAATHNFHEELALLAIGAGKHVVVEKPIAVTAAGARRIADAAAAAGVFAMEAMWMRYLPHSDVAQQLIESGALGEVLFAQAEFGFPAPADPTHRLRAPELAGGALLDLGVYPLGFVHLGLPEVFADSASISVVGSLSGTRVDGHSTIALQTASGAHALATQSIEAPLANAGSIAGRLGRLEVPTPFWAPSRLVFTPTEGEPLEFDGTRIAEGDGLAYEAAAAARFIADGLLDSPVWSLADATASLRIIDEARRSLGYLNGLEE